MAPAFVTFTTVPWKLSTVHTLPSGPAVIPWRNPLSAYFVTTPLGVTLSIAPVWLTHRLPSAPVVMPYGALYCASAYSVRTPAAVILATFDVAFSTNHTLPSGPAVMPMGAVVVPAEYSTTLVAAPAPDAPATLPDAQREARAAATSAARGRKMMCIT